MALLSQEGSVTRQGHARGGSHAKLCNDAVLEPPLARFRLCLNRAAPLTQGGDCASLLSFSATCYLVPCCVTKVPPECRTRYSGPLPRRNGAGFLLQVYKPVQDDIQVGDRFDFLFGRLKQ